ncbi:MAG: histidine kinase [Desulfomicrobiaceae bacterium]|jgi:two-component system NtrC family sensor kinase|nr:histidine kinase [Desulfomicrobiaceae bacterium]
MKEEAPSSWAEAATAPSRYRTLQRKIVALIAVAALLPLFSLAFINYYEHQHALTAQVQEPLRALVGKTKHSFELYLTERISAINFIASAYSFEQLADKTALNRIFQIMSQAFTGFVDISLIDDSGKLISYVGPYNLKDINYTEQKWFQQVLLRGSYISDVFLGFRQFPHVVVAVRHNNPDGRSWIVRATLDTAQFENIIASMGLEPGSDAFLTNRKGVLQTESRQYGHVLEPLSFSLPPANYEANVYDFADPAGGQYFLALSQIANTDFVLVAMKPRPSLLKAWYTVRLDMVAVFVAGVCVIFAGVFAATRMIIQRLQESDAQRLAAIHQMEHTQRLSSIGRLAAGVAHEINNPLAIINEKAGLLRDLLELRPDFPDKERFAKQIDAILRSVDRSRGITHRMLGFAKRMDVRIEVLDLNAAITETIGFLEREAQYRNVTIERRLAPDLPQIPSDYGQIQQVVLNILNNALAAVADGGTIAVSTWDEGERVGIAVADNGCGMSEETVKHIFEPFFTTKKEKGTGLGMSITYGIVKRLGGDIHIQSALGKGTTVTIFLPKHPPEEQGGSL